MEENTGELIARTTVSWEDFQEACEGLRDVAVRTPLVRSEELSARVGAPVLLKCEQFQPSGSFKTRGAFTAIRRRMRAGPIEGVITFSSGNHAQAVAYAARRLDLRAVLVMPTTAPEIKVRGVERWGGEVVFAGTTSEDRRLRAEAIAREESLAMIPPFDDPDVVAGQGTVAVEVLEQAQGVRQVVVPAGGGGLAAGVATALRAAGSSAEVTVVEPVGAPTVARALAAGHPVTLESTESVADGLLPLRMGGLPCELLLEAGVRCVQVSDDEIRTAAAWLFRTMGMAAEPSGAATTAAIMAGRVACDGTVVAVVSGGNVSTLTLSEW